MKIECWVQCYMMVGEYSNLSTRKINCHLQIYISYFYEYE